MLHSWISFCNNPSYCAQSGNEATAGAFGVAPERRSLVRQDVFPTRLEVPINL